MRTSDVDILIVPGWSGSGPGHWQSRWERNFKTARRVQQDDFYFPRREEWVAAIVEAVSAAERPVVLVGHSLGVIAVAHAAPLLNPGKVAGAFLVAPADTENAEAWPLTEGFSFESQEDRFAPLPKTPLPFPSMLVASRSDPYCSFERAEELAEGWGATLVDAGDIGHVNIASGHGPWPEGLLRFGLFLKGLPGPAAETH